MNKYKDFSLHFTTKGQSVEDIKQKYYDFDAETMANNTVLVDPDLGDRDELILHHCFAPESVLKDKGIPTDALEFLDTVCDQQIQWYYSAENPEYSRYAMLQNLKRLGGVAIFLGEIKENVRLEHDYAKEIGLPCILID